MTSRSSIKGLWLRILASIFLAAIPFVSEAQQSSPDTDKLGMALEYFQTGKYHESLIIFQQLDKHYKLNPRFRAYIGLCYYHEWNYKKAVEYFDKVLPLLGGLAPHELSVYYYAAGESYFQMQKYDKALPYYQKDLKVCYNLEKGDVYYRIGLCHMFAKEWQQAYDSYSESEKFYKEYRDTTGLESRLAQIANMKNGCMHGISLIIDSERSQLLKSSSSSTNNEGEHSSETESPWDSIVLQPFPETFQTSRNE